MTYRRRYQISLISFGAATLYMLNVQGRMQALGMAGKINGWIIFEMFLSFALLLVAIIWFAIARSQKNLQEVDREWLLIESQRGANDDDTRK